MPEWESAKADFAFVAAVIPVDDLFRYSRSDLRRGEACLARMAEGHPAARVAGAFRRLRRGDWQRARHASPLRIDYRIRISIKPDSLQRPYEVRLRGLRGGDRSRFGDERRGRGSGRARQASPLRGSVR